ncbi:thioredoxin-like domain-containing protein [Niastella populi]|uniref:Thioredoxin domain-containing protein n=1 Tax=Niastella populi TaxID=550983 RepID=A0A1V9GAX3_9BACT|nr:thioredoxin-like domain-containing protein [Niastella populi]OQP67608.1 hypothetical protein A4R26_12410 [Niastella populi]
MKSRQTLFAVFFILFSQQAFSQLNTLIDSCSDAISNTKDIYIEVRKKSTTDDSAEIYYLSIDARSVSKEYTSLKSPKGTSGYSWRINSKTPVLVNTSRFFKHHKTWIAEPGDSLIIIEGDHGLSFTGAGADKYRLLYEIEIRKQQVPKPENINFYRTESVEDFLQTNAYLNSQLYSVLSLIETYKHQLSDFAFKKVKVSVISSIHEQRLDKFTGLIKLYQKGLIDVKTVSKIFDTCFYSENWRWVLNLPDYAPGWYAFIRAEVARKYNYNYSLDSLKSRELRKFLYYDQGKRTYKGLALDQFLLSLITDETMYEIGFTPQTEKLIKRYYVEQGNPEFKRFVKAYEVKARTLKGGSLAPEFSLVDINGEIFTKKKLKGKIAVIDFWFTGCKGCLQITPALEKLKRKFNSDSNIVFVSISIDKEKDQWLSSIKKQLYSTDGAINLYTGGLGGDHSVIETYNISAYPALFVLDGTGHIVENPLPDPRHPEGFESLSKLIEKQLTLLHDGPYVFFADKGYKVNVINGTQLSSTTQNGRGSLLYMQTNEYAQKLAFSLHPLNKFEPSVFPNPSKMFTLSDIEGNFDAFRKLLQANKIIDENYNWIFGDGHLVFAGDMFDRGQQVTECLWLIYSLEEKAKKAGGYVHFILGNHEIMNLNGKAKYVQDKYNNNAALMNLPYISLYGKDTELGRWLRTKNIIEKIGDHLFLHGGISKEILELNLSLKDINHLARSHYDKESLARKSKDVALRRLFDSKVSPFWYRLYYQKESVKYYPTDTLYKPSMQLVDLTLRKYGALSIITGHTIVADTISVHYQGRVFNTDTRHAEGHSEGLLIEGDEFFRTNQKGERVLLCTRRNTRLWSQRDITQ